MYTQLHKDMNLVCEPYSLQHQTIKLKRSKKFPKRILKRIKSRKLKEKRKIMDCLQNNEVSTISDEEYDMLSDIEFENK